MCRCPDASGLRTAALQLPCVVLVSLLLQQLTCRVSAIDNVTSSQAVGNLGVRGGITEALRELYHLKELGSAVPGIPAGIINATLDPGKHKM